MSRKGGVVLRIANKELRDVVRERSIVVALLVQFFIAAFSAFLAVGLLAIYDPESVRAEVRADVAYVGGEGEGLGGEGDGPGDGFHAYLAAEKRLRVVRLDAAQALAGFYSGQFEAVVQEQASPDGTHTVTVLLPDGQLQTTLLVTQIKGLLQDYELDLRAARQERLQHEVRELELPPQTRSPVPYAFLFATLLPLLLMTPVFLSGAIAADSLSAELQSRSLTILRSAPASLPAILAGKLLVPLLLAPLQFFLWAGLLALNGIHAQNLPMLGLVSLLLTLVLAGTGYALAARLRRDGPTQAAYALTAITLAGVSLLMPRDPLNLIAYLATGRIDGAAWLSMGILAAAATVSVVLGFGDAARSIRGKPD